MLADLAELVVTVSHDLPAAEALLKPLTDAASYENPADVTLARLRIACNEALSNIEDQVDADRRQFFTSCTGLDGTGAKGTAKSSLQRGINGPDGRNGREDISIAVEDRFLDPPPFITAHPLQCKMFLEKARALFFYDRPKCRALTVRLMETLATRLAFLPTEWSACASDPYLEPYRKVAGTMAIPSGTDVVRDLFETRAEAHKLLIQLCLFDVDCYGHARNWIPRIGLDELLKESTAAVDHLKEIEQWSLQYHAAAEKDKRALLQAQGTRSHIASNKKYYTRQLDNLRKSLGKILSEINDKRLVKELDDARRDAREKLEHLSVEIQNHLDLSPESCFKAYETVAFCPDNPVMYASQEVSLGYEAYAKVPDDTGLPVDKSHLISGIRKLDGGLKDLVHAESTAPTGEGHLGVSNPPLVVVEQSKLDNLLEDFSQSSFASTAKQAKALLKHYLTLCGQRNQKIIRYNQQLDSAINMLCMRDRLQTAESTSEMSLLGHDNIVEGGIDAASGLVGAFLEASRERCTWYLSLLRRSIHFSSLEEPRLFDDEAEIDEEWLDMTGLQLEELHQRPRGQLCELQERAGSDATPFLGNSDQDGGGGGRRYHLSSAELDRLMREGECDITLAPVFRDRHGDSEFAGCANARIYRVRCWLKGLKLRHGNQDSLVKIGIRHGGLETIVDEDNNAHHFTHEPIDVQWCYRLFDANRSQAVDSGDFVRFKRAYDKDSTEFSAPGVFTTWTLSLRDLSMERLDLTGVDGGYMEFFGTSRSFRGADYTMAVGGDERSEWRKRGRVDAGCDA